MTASLLQRLNVLYMAQFMAAAVRRFPLPALLAVLLTLLTVAEIHNLDILTPENLIRSLLFCGFGFVLTLGFSLYGEGHGTARPRILAASFAALGLLCAAVFAPAHLSAAHIFLAAALGLFLLASPFVRRTVSGDTLWAFNYKSAIAVIFGMISALILAGGLSAILFSIDYLFEIKINSKLYADIWAFGWCLFFPLYVMAGVPRALHDNADSPCDIPAPVSFIANYLMVPMMLVYTGILYAYGLKIAFQWDLPRGNLAYMVTGFGAIGVLTHLCIYPLRDRGTRLLRFFFASFYALLPVPLLLLAMGIYTRLSAYGVTEQRYAIVLCLVWLSGLTLLKTVFAARFHLKHVPLMLCVLCLLAAFGPWSAREVALNSQYARLEQHLRAAGVLTAEDKVQKTEATLAFEDRRAISSALEFFHSRNALPRLETWIAPVAADMDKTNPQDALKGLRCGKRDRCPGHYNMPRRIAAAWGIDYVTRWDRQGTEHLYIAIPAHNRQGQLIELGGYDYMLQGYVHYTSDKRQADKPLPFAPHGTQGISLMLDEDRNLVLRLFREGEAPADLVLPTKAAATALRAFSAAEIPAAQADIAVLRAENAHLRAEFRIANLNDDRDQKDQTRELRSIGGILLFSIVQP
jgi:hypothetical protein